MEGNQNSDSEIEENEVPGNTVQNFDMNLAAEHSYGDIQSQDILLNGFRRLHEYLGQNLQEFRRRTVLDDNSVHILPVLPYCGMSVMPGQTFPYLSHFLGTISMLRSAIESKGIFGVLCRSPVDPETGATVPNYGTIAEIFEYDDEAQTEGFRLKARGRQRFKVVEMKRVNRQDSAVVKILPEVVLPSSLHGSRFSCLDRYRSTPCKKPMPHSAAYRRRGMKQNSIARRDSIVTVWPYFVHKQYDPDYLSHEVRSRMSYLKMGVEESDFRFSKNPMELSYWVAQSLPLTDEHRMMLLSINSPIQRLRWELSIMKDSNVLCCKDCRNIICYPKDCIIMSAEGPQAVYVNPAGFLHDTVTFTRAEGVKANNTEPSTDHSWFPGYAWIIVECKYCYRHVGWKFVATEPTMRPHKFVGIRRHALKPLISEDALPVM